MSAYFFNRVKKSGIAITLTLSVVSSQLSVVSATSPLETAQSDYNFEYSKFRDAQDKYVNSKNSYLTFKTATAKDQAYLDSKAYLNQAINLYLAYLSLINENANSLEWQNDQTDTQVINIIKDLKNSYLQQEQLINLSQTLEDLSTDAATLSEKQTKEINPALYWMITNLELARARQLQNQFENLATTLAQNKQAFANTTTMSNWQSEIDNISNNSKAHITEAQKQMERVTPDRASEGDAQAIASTVALSRNELKKAVPLFNEAAKNQ